jgi:hypothetical protein
MSATWSIVGATPNFNSAYLAFSGSIYCKVTYSGYAGAPPSTVSTSTDGISFTAHTQPYRFTGIFWDGTKFIAPVAGDNPSDANLASSTDGVTWTLLTGTNVASAYRFSGVVGGSALRVACPRFSADESSTDSTALTSTDGTTWGIHSLPDGGSWTYGAYRAGAVCLLGAYMSPDYYVRDVKTTHSTDGVSWTVGAPPMSGSAGWGLGICATPSGFLIADSGSNRIATSSDGINWTSQTSPSYSINGLFSANELFFLIGNDIDGNTVIYSSPDGATWMLISGFDPADTPTLIFGDGTNTYLYSSAGNVYSLGAAVPPAVVYFWTGNKLCLES